jgi:hypothetical protein
MLDWIITTTCALGLGVLGNWVAAQWLAQGWAIGIGLMLFAGTLAVGRLALRRLRQRPTADSATDELRELVARNSGGNIELTGDEGTLDCQVGFLNEFSDTATITLTMGSLVGVGSGGPMELSVVQNEFDLPPRGARLTADAEVWRRLRFRLTATQCDRIRSALSLVRGQAATRQGTWSLFPAGHLRRPSGIMPWERGQSVLFTVREIPT